MMPWIRVALRLFGVGVEFCGTHFGLQDLHEEAGPPSVVVDQGDILIIDITAKRRISMLLGLFAECP